MKSTLNKSLLLCGMLSSLLYTAMNAIVPAYFEGYDQLTFTISELSAIGAPTRELWVQLAIFYPILLLLFGWGVLRSANGNDKIRALGFLIFFYAIINVYWPPMHPRGMGVGLTDILHIIWSFISVTAIILIMSFGALAFGLRFRIYTFVTIGMLVIFGFLTGLEAPNIPKDLPTPWIGLWERIMVGVFLIWVGAISIMMLRENETRVTVRLKEASPDRQIAHQKMVERK